MYFIYLTIMIMVISLAANFLFFFQVKTQQIHKRIAKHGSENTLSCISPLRLNLAKTRGSGVTFAVCDYTRIGRLRRITRTLHYDTRRPISERDMLEYVSANTQLSWRSGRLRPLGQSRVGGAALRTTSHSERPASERPDSSNRPPAQSQRSIEWCSPQQ